MNEIFGRIPVRRMNWLETNGASLRAIREAKRISQRKFAKQVGIHYSMVSRMERGQRNPGKDLASKIAEALGVPLEAIFFARDDGR